MKAQGEHPKVFLPVTGAHAELCPDELTGGTILTIDGHAQSHVDPSDPARVFYAYLDRIRNGLELVFSGAHGGPDLSLEPLRIAHVGAGALTLARALEASHPGSEHIVVDHEPRLVPFVLEHLPFEGYAEFHAQDALVWAHEAAAEVAESPQEGYDAVVVDIFTGWESPEHLCTPEFYGLMRSLLGPDGVLALNVGDEAPLSFTRAQLHALRAAFSASTAREESPRDPQGTGERTVAVSTEPAMLNRTLPGNSVMLARVGGFGDSFARAWEARGPYPAWAGAGADVDEGFGFTAQSCFPGQG